MGAATPQTPAVSPQGLVAWMQSDPIGVIDAPARLRAGIVIHVGKPSKIFCRREGDRHTGTAVHGDVDIIPPRVSSRWELMQPDTALIVGVPEEFLVKAAEDAGCDPARAQIVNRFQMRDRGIESLAWALKAEVESDCANGKIYLDSLGAALAIQLVNRHSTGARVLPPVRAGLAGHRLKRVLGFIEENLANDLSLAEIAAVAGLSVSHCNVAFRQSIGHSLHQYITRRRVEYAHDLLRREPLTVAEVAAATGFAHGSHLARHMRRLLGVAPASVARTTHRLSSDPAQTE